MEPVQYSILDIFIRYGYRPTVRLSHTKRSIPDDSCTEISHNSTDGCHDSAYKINLSNDINTSGTYFIGVLYDEETGNRKRRRKRSVLPSYDPTTDVNYTMNILQEKCLSWNRTDEMWTSPGCQACYLAFMSFFFIINHSTLTVWPR